MIFYLKSLSNDQYDEPERISVPEALHRMLNCEEITVDEDGKEFTLWGFPRHGDKIKVEK